MKRRFTIYDLRHRLPSRARDLSEFTIWEKSAKPAAVAHPSSLVPRPSQSGVALVITVIMLAVVTFMAITFLAISRRERGAVTTTTDTVTAQLAADDALAAAEAQIIANTLAITNPYNFGLLVSTNYINPYGFQNAGPGYASFTNVSYYYPNGNPVVGNDFLQLLANLYYLPRPPVFIPTNSLGSNDFRFYLDLNRNGEDDPNGLVINYVNYATGASNGVISEVGDPEWIGVLQHPDQPYGPNNPFVARYAFIAVPIGNALDLNNIFNQALDPVKAGQANFISVNPSPYGVGNDAFLRNQGVGSWEINLAAFLADLNTNEWGQVVGSGSSALAGSATYYQYNQPVLASSGHAFDDARALLAYRYDNNYNTLAPVAGINPNGIFTTAATLSPFQDNIDYYSDGPLITTPVGINVGNQNVTWPWAGAPNTNQFFDMQELFNPNESSVAFTNRLLSAGTNYSTYNRYTYYRLLSQMGVDSAPEQSQINLNYSNAFAYFNNYGVVTNITIFPGAETNLVPWTPLQFFTIAADRMLRTYSQEWLIENPTNYVATYCITTNIGTLADPTNVPVPFGISDIPVLISNQFVYTPAIQRVLQLAANIYDATTNNTAVMGMNFPSVFRPIFLVTNNLASGYTNIYIAGYEPVGYNGQIGVVPGGTNNYQLALPVNVTDLLNPNYQNLNYGYSAFSPGSGIYTSVNVYGMPWIIGAKKGFPNFNEFALESVFQLTRKLQVTRQNTNDTYVNNPGDYNFNQMFNLSLSNQLAVECWNSYTNYYQFPQPRSAAMYVNDTLSVTLTNDEFPSKYFSYTTNFLITSLLQIPNPTLTAWPGYSSLIIPSPSFQIPLNVGVSVIPTSMYRFNEGNTVLEPGYNPLSPSSPYLTTNLNSPFESDLPLLNGTIYPQPHWYLITTNNVQVIMLDTSGPYPQIIDYVQLSGPDTVRDLSYEIMTNYDTPFITTEASGNELWNTNVQNGVPIGILSQIGVADGNYTAGAASGVWNSSGSQQQNEIAGFTAFMGYTPTPPLTAGELSYIALAQTSLSNQAPYSPVATMIQIADWQVNDPLVHYLAEDIDQPGIETPFRAPAPPTPIPTLTNSAYATIGYLNKQRYMPWGISVQAPTSVDANPYNLAYKDPLVRQSDDWDFPTYKLPTIGWLGHVHRGTPWQTIYLKSPDILHEIQVTKNLNVLTTNIPYMGTNTWVWWTGNSLLANGQYYDAANAAPAQDRLLFDLFTTAPNDNATRGTLSVNVGASDINNLQAGLAAWSALFSGVQVLANNAADSAINPTVLTDWQHNGSLANFTSFPINPAGPAGASAPVGQIVTGINQTRANVNNTPWISTIQSMAGGGVTIADEIPATFANADGVDGAFEHVGDILAVPQLSVQSPFLNWSNSTPLPNGVTYQQANGISDEMYDWLPQQVLSLLRVSGTPQSPMRYVIYSYGQALKPAPNGIYTGGGPYFGMITNYQVVAETASRAVVNFGSVETNVITTNIDNNWISVPVVTNNNAQIEQFNVLPPY